MVTDVRTSVTTEALHFSPPSPLTCLIPTINTDYLPTRHLQSSSYQEVERARPRDLPTNVLSFRKPGRTRNEKSDFKCSVSRISVLEH